MKPNGTSIARIRGFVGRVSAKTTWIVVAVDCVDGLQGFGEASRFGTEAALLAEIANADRVLSGADISTPGAALARFAAPGGGEARRIVASAVEQAMLDAMARRARLSLADMLGGATRGAVPVYANINRGTEDRSPAGFAARARTAIADGYDAVKIAPFDGVRWNDPHDSASTVRFDAGIERILATRSAIGPGGKLMVDCHERLSPIRVRALLAATASAGLFWIEDPCAADEFPEAATRAIRGKANDLGIRIAGGEKLRGLADARRSFAREDIDTVLPDLRWTGVREGLAILALADASGIEASLHNPAGPVLDRISLQVAAAAPRFSILERQYAESPLFDRIGGAPAAANGGALALPADAGFGPVPNLAALSEAAAGRGADA